MSEKPKGFLQDGQGDLSTMRLIAIWAASVGTYLVLAGSVAMFLGMPSAPVAIGSGAGLFSIGLGAKAFQASHEP